jgi:hypothetical protein
VRSTIVVALHQLALRFINLPRELDPLPHTVVLLSVVILVPSALPILGIGLGLRKVERDKLFGYSCAIFGAILPIVCLLTASFLLKPVYVMRYVVPSLPFFLLTLAAGLFELPPAFMKVGLGLLLVGNSFGTLEYYRVPTKPIWPGAIDYLVSDLRPDDRIALIPSYERIALDYNLSRLDRRLPKGTVLLAEEQVCPWHST